MYDRIFDMIQPGLKKNKLVAEIYSTAINGSMEPAVIILPSCH